MVLIKVPLKVIDWELVSTLEFAIVFAIDLNRIIRQMNESRIKIGKVELFGRGAEIAVSVHESFEFTIDRGQESIASNIKFTVVN